MTVEHMEHIALTARGTAYCEAQRQDIIRQEASEIIEGCFDLIERMLGVLDNLDGDSDLEDTGDLEPSLCGVGRIFSGIFIDDLEADPAEYENSCQPLSLNGVHS